MNDEMKSPLEYIRDDIESNSITSGMLDVRTANDTIQVGLSQPDPKDLYEDKGLVIEGEATCLFADTGAGKSVLAVQIAEYIAKKQPVLYVDFELSTKQFQMRYTGENGKIHLFPDYFYRAELSLDKICDIINFEDVVLSNIEGAANRVGARVIIIDNLTYICNGSEKGEIASEFMKKIISKKKQGWTVIVIAHTPKRSLFSPISENDLAGSKRLMNFFDSAFCIGKSAKQPHLRYIKQVKVRSTEMKYDSDNVMICEFVKTSDNALRLEIIGQDREKNHLRILTEDESREVKQQIVRLYSQGFSYREIEEKLGVSKSQVGRTIAATKNEDAENEEIPFGAISQE